uniref:beta strand repeat-containing protein n=1 Tax=Anaerovibrio lipolyticus TaxID=82374 RepID=UPI0023F25DE3
MKKRHSKKELTCLILTALVLAGGSFYIPMAEAEDVTGENKTISSGTYDNTNVYAGKANSSGNATNNKLTISGGSFSGSSGSHTHIYGGWATEGNATGNEVIISGGTFNNLVDIFGGSAASGQSATGNQVTLEVNNQQFYQLTGGIAGGNEVYTGNTLNLNGTGNNVAFNLYGFGTIAVQSGVTFAAGTTVLRTGTTTTEDYNVGIQCANNATLDFTGATNLIGNNTSTGTMTILTSERHDMSELKVKNESGTAVAMGTTANPVTVKNHTNVETAVGNGVNMLHTSTHTVFFSDDYWYDEKNKKNVYNIKVNYNIANTVTGFNLASWNGQTATVSVPTGWTKGTNLSISGSFSPPTLGTGITSKDILTAGADFFSGATIDNTIAYSKKSEFTNEAIGTTGVTLSGDKKSGVKVEADGTKANAKLTYYGETKEVTTANFGNMTWGTNTGASGSGYTFGNTTIDASNLTFSGKITSNPLGQSMNLLTDATGIYSSSAITQPGTNKGTIAAEFTDATSNIAFTGSVKGTVSASTTSAGSDGNVKYTLDKVALTAIDLDEWNGEKVELTTAYNTTELANGSIHVDKFASTTSRESDMEILTAEKDGFFNDSQITGALAYGDGEETKQYTDKGVTLDYKMGGGVKASVDGRKLLYYATLLNTKKITLGDIKWGDGLTAPTGYNFNDLESIVATDLKFTNPLDIGTTTTLVSGASGLPASFATITDASLRKEFTDAVAGNNVKLDGNYKGTVSTTAGQVNYTIDKTTDNKDDKTITKVNLSGWDSTKAAHSLSGWLSGLAADKIIAAGFTAPTNLIAGDAINILTSGSNNFFDDNYITGAQQYGLSTATYSDVVNGVTFTGSQTRGVAAANSGQDLVYKAGTMTVSDITLGNMEVGVGGTVTKRTADNNYIFNNNSKIDATSLKFDKPAEVQDSTLVTVADGITADNTVTKPNHSQAITNAAMGGGITVSGTLTGT